VLSLAVLLVDASYKSRSPAPIRQLDAQAWIDRVLPLVTESTAQGQEMAQVWDTGLGMSAPAITGRLDGVARGAKRVYEKVVSFPPPSSVAGASGLLEACLLARSQAAAELAKAVAQGLSTAPPPGPGDVRLQVMASAGQDLEVSDRAYELFRQNVPSDLLVPMPASTWVAASGVYQPATLEVFLQSVHNASNLAPVHQLSVVAVGTSPPPVSISGGVQVLPPQRQIEVSIVVADTGNQPEPNLTITAAITPAAGASSVRDFFSLTPGTSHATTIGPLEPPQGPVVTLTVTASALPGSPTTPAVSSISLEMPAPSPASTTTTTTPPG
jgi:hypothetical protein